MKKASYVFCFSIIAATAGCIQAIKSSFTVEGSWVFQDASENSFMERTLVFENGTFSEIRSENLTPFQQDDGTYSVNMNGTDIEIKLSGKEKRTYTGKIAPLGLMIEKIDDTDLAIPLFYKRG